MFCALLKAKLEIEAKINNLQKNYLELLSSSVRQLEFSNQNNTEIASSLLKAKVETVEKIIVDYKAALNQHHQTSAEIIETKETAEQLEADLDNLLVALQIEVPEELKKQPVQLTEIVQRLSIQTAFELSDEEEENKENSKNCPESEEEENASDKENSVLNSSGGYFSPNIQIKKSFVSDNDALYTPAIKSSSKLPLFKRQL